MSIYSSNFLNYIYTYCIYVYRAVKYNIECIYSYTYSVVPIFVYKAAKIHCKIHTYTYI